MNQQHLNTGRDDLEGAHAYKTDLLSQSLVGKISFIARSQGGRGVDAAIAESLVAAGFRRRGRQ